MNNRTLWQLTADGVTDLRDNQKKILLQNALKRRQEMLIEDIEIRGLEQHQMSTDELVAEIFAWAKGEIDRTIKRHDFELSSGKTEDGNHKVFTVR
jgi:hypothetical protein